MATWIVRPSAPWKGAVARNFQKGISTGRYIKISEPISKPISGFRFPPVKMVHRLDRSSVTVKKERGRDPHGEPAGNGGHEEIDDENNLKMK